MTVRTHGSREDRSATMLALALIASALFVVVLLVALLWVLPSYFEARAFERVTGRAISTWDAMFLDLRVSEAPER